MDRGLQTPVLYEFDSLIFFTVIPLSRADLISQIKMAIVCVSFLLTCLPRKEKAFGMCLRVTFFSFPLLNRTLAHNIVVIGGTVNIPGFVSRLVEELNACLEWPEFASLSALKGEFRVHQPPGEPNYIAWLGGKNNFVVHCFSDSFILIFLFVSLKNGP